MIEKRFLAPFEKMTDDSVSESITRKYVDFLNSANDKELKEIGWAIFYIFPKDVQDQIIPFFNKKGEHEFISDYVNTYSLPEKMTSKDKARGSKLLALLDAYPGMTASDFIAM